MTAQTCPHCGADGYFNVRDADWRYGCHSSCNADGSEFYTAEDCYKRQLAQQAAEIERLRSALDKYGSHHENCSFVQLGTPIADRPCFCGFNEARGELK